MGDEFRMQPAGWIAPVDLDQLIDTCVDDTYHNAASYLASRSDVADEVRATVAAAREYERARIVAAIELHRATAHAVLVPGPEIYAAYDACIQIARSES